MATAISVQEAVRLAKDALGNAPTEEMVAWIAANLGLTIKPVIVTVMLGSFLEKEHLERARLKAMELLEMAKTEEAIEKPKGRRKAKATAGRADCPQAGPTLQCPSAPNEDRINQNRNTAQGCLGCGGTDYVFRGRKKVAAEPGKEADLETKYACRTCGHQWKVRTLG